jgi:uncharacterized protein (UPF0147 family)
MMAFMAGDETMLVDYRATMWYYLKGSCEEQYVELVWEYINDFISCHDYSSPVRYKVIANMLSPYGIKTILNWQRINIPVDPDFVIGLQETFFFDTENELHERILSGQYILQTAHEVTIETYNDDEKSFKTMLDINEQLVEMKSNVSKILLTISGDETIERNIRRQAVDVVLREGYPAVTRNQAREIIEKMGYSELNENTGATNLFTKTKTIYSNSENVHSLWIKVEPFVESIVKDTSIKLREYHEIQSEIVTLIQRRKRGKERFNGIKALDRISIDTASFTQYKSTLAEILIHVWLRITQKYQDDIQSTLIDRLLEELCDMTDTCSSGHAARIVNVLSGFELDINIDWKDQVIANIDGRLNARITKSLDQGGELADIISLGSMDDADKADKEAYQAFVTEQLSTIRKEMYAEFVGDNYISDDQFDDYFEAGVKVLTEAGEN